MSNILILTAGFPPSKTYGGPAISINNVVKNVKKHNYFIITNDYEYNVEKKISGVISNIEKNYTDNSKVIYLDKEHYKFNEIQDKLSKKPDLVYVNSFFSFKQLKMAIKFSDFYQIPILLAPRGELEEGALNHKKNKYYLKRLYISLYVKLIKKRKIYYQFTNIDEKKNIMKWLGASNDQTIFLKNIPTISEKNIKSFKKIKGNIKIIFVSRIQKKKNLNYILNILEKINNSIEIRFDIYGSIENEEYWINCKKKISNLSKNIIVKYKGILNHEDVVPTIAEYDLFFLPTMSENFGHVIYEAIASKTLILISDQTPWTDINLSQSGKAFSLLQPEKFIQYIEKVASLNNTEYKLLIDNQNDYLNEKLNVNKIIHEYELFFNNFHSDINI